MIDLGSRKVVGWATADHLRTDLVEQALCNAVTQRRPEPGVIFHSDRGCQYTSGQYARAAADAGVRLSVGRKGQCWDNAVAESFFATIKTELLDRQSWPTKAKAHKAIFEYVEGWYKHPPRAFQPRLPQPRHLRSHPIPPGRSGSVITPHRPCPSKRGNPSPSNGDAGPAWQPYPCRTRRPSPS